MHAFYSADYPQPDRTCRLDMTFTAAGVKSSGSADIGATLPRHTESLKLEAWIAFERQYSQVNVSRACLNTIVRAPCPDTPRQTRLCPAGGRPGDRKPKTNTMSKTSVTHTQTHTRGQAHTHTHVHMHIRVRFQIFRNARTSIR